MTAVRRPALRYFGGKWRLSSWIISHFPEHSTYVEPYCGGASVFLRKAPAAIEVLNDLDEDVVTFFRVLRDQEDELIRAIELTPFSRIEFERAFEERKRSRVGQALALYIRCWQAYGGRRVGSTGWRTGARGENKRASVVRDWNATKRLHAVAARLKDAHIECSPATDIIQRFDSSETLFYVDPPYPAETRSQRWNDKAYRHEMTPSDHVDLAQLLHSIEGTVVLSTIPNELYDHLYKDWPRATKGAYVGMGANSSRKYTEQLIISPNPKPRTPRFQGQQSFDSILEPNQ